MCGNLCELPLRNLNLYSIIKILEGEGIRVESGLTEAEVEELRVFMSECQEEEDEVFKNLINDITLRDLLKDLL